MDESAMEREIREEGFADGRSRTSAQPDIEQINLLTGVENRNLAAYILYLEEKIDRLERRQLGVEQG